MESIMADERGRITLGAKIIDRYGKKFAVVETEKDIVLVPMAQDPLKELQKIGKEAGIDNYTIKELRKMAMEEAEKEVEEELKRHVRR